MIYLNLFFIALFGFIFGDILCLVANLHLRNCEYAVQNSPHIQRKLLPPLFSKIFLTKYPEYHPAKNMLSYKYSLSLAIINSLLWALSYYAFADSNILLFFITIQIISLSLLIICLDIKNQKIVNIHLFVLALLTVLFVIVDDRLLWYEHIIGLGLGAGVFFLSYFLARERTGRMQNIIIVGLCGLLLGWQNILVAIIISALLAIIYIAFTSFLHTSRYYPFTPFFMSATILALFYGSNLIDWYASLFI